MVQRFIKHIDENFSFLKEKKLLVACSGGLDSVVLANLCQEAKLDFALAHCNFSLRGKESDGDEDFVENLAAKFGVSVFIETFDTKKYAADNRLSIQMAARELRYRWFYELLENLDFDFLLTAHHLDDAMETFFINLSRGSGLKGLSGIPAINGKVVRPLLVFSKNELVYFAKKTNQNWREDSSNSKADYLRNKVRLEVLPLFKAIGESVLENFHKTQNHLKNSQNLIDDYLVLIHKLVVAKTGSGYSLDLNKLRELPNTEALLYELLSPFGFTAWDDIFGLLGSQSGKQVFSKTHRLLKDRDVLILTELLQPSNEEQFFINEKTKAIDFPVPLTFERVEKSGKAEKHEIFVDLQLLSFPLLLRKWQEGDAFQPFGMTGKKKLSKFFKDEKISLIEKEKKWVLCSEDSIVWIVGHRMDDGFKVTQQTKKILKISLEEA